jgi:hypothetical protein
MNHFQNAKLNRWEPTLYSIDSQLTLVRVIMRAQSKVN